MLWGSETESIHKVQKSAQRIISDNKFNAHTEPICRAERLLKVKEIYRLGIKKFYYKLINNYLPHYFHNFTPTFSDGVNYYSLRNPIREIPRIKYEFPRHSLRYKLIETLNNTSETITVMAISQSQKIFIGCIKNDMIAIEIAVTFRTVTYVVTRESTQNEIYLHYMYYEITCNLFFLHLSFVASIIL